MIIDLGISKEISLELDTQANCRTAEYMDPEILNCSNYNKSVDIWVIGIILYELLFYASSKGVGTKRKSFQLEKQRHESFRYRTLTITNIN